MKSPENTLIIKSEKKYIIIKAIKMQDNNKPNAFRNTLGENLVVEFSEDIGNMALLIGTVPQKIIFDRIDAIA